MPSSEAELVQIQGTYRGGGQLNPERRLQMEHCERVLSQLGFRYCRVHHHDKIARIEVGSSEEFQRLLSPEFRDEISRSFREIGFTYTAVDLQAGDQQSKEEES